jgi:xanthine dehydrogenase YagT iron-sulfur-binding subunit
MASMDDHGQRDRRQTRVIARNRHERGGVMAESNWTRREFLEASSIAAGGLVAIASGAVTVSATSVAAEAREATGAVEIAVRINGETKTLAVEPRTSLLDMLREQLQLTGTKKGCDQGACGACTVLVGGRRINACLTLAVMHHGAEITTIEGLASGETLHPVQAAFIEHEAFQCGYCTSGQILSAVACIAEGHAESADEIRAWMSGNICRCGAYPGIVAAVGDAARRT